MRTICHGSLGRIQVEDVGKLRDNIRGMYRNANWDSNSHVLASVGDTLSDTPYARSHHRILASSCTFL